MKFGNSVADIFIIKHTEFGKDAFGLDNSTVHCLGVQFFRGYSVYLSCLTQSQRLQNTIQNNPPD